ncbi:hypothetical protein [Citromicrobium bathyomarinum]|uniref:hypothetical protein n=1 Tax=Citromicrobium bathyomarinum TaxID=72174 RepID=UPI00315B2122
MPDELIVPLHTRNIALSTKPWQLSPICHSSISSAMADFRSIPSLARGLQSMEQHQTRTAIMQEQAQSKRIFGKAVLVTILATAALVAVNPLSADATQTSSPLVLQTVELA